LDSEHFVAPDKRECGDADLKELGVAGETILMCIFRLEKLKLPDHLVQIVALLKSRGCYVKGLFVGDGSMREELVTLAKELGVSDQIIFCGNRDQFWLSRVIPLVSVVVSTLTGRALAEAALGGVPIVAYDIDWHGEAIETGLTGELVPYLDYSSMADSVEKILNDHDYSKAIGSNVRERMLKLMDPKANDKILKGVYEELLKPKSV
jgi:glycosyltransferase involved in cell wall biosynthesis